MKHVFSDRPTNVLELYQMLPEGTLAEIIDGALYISPSPTNLHQAISMDLSVEIGKYIKQHGLGKILAAPCDVYLDNGKNVVQPDLLIILKQNESILQNHVYGVPDMIIEILSPGSIQHDSVRKKGLYEQFGVKEFWMIDPSTKLATGFYLNESRFKEIGTFESELQSRLLEAAFRFG